MLETDEIEVGEKGFCFFEGSPNPEEYRDLRHEGEGLLDLEKTLWRYKAEYIDKNAGSRAGKVTTPYRRLCLPNVKIASDISLPIDCYHIDYVLKVVPSLGSGL